MCYENEPAILFLKNDVSKIVQKLFHLYVENASYDVGLIMDFISRS